MKLDLIWTGKSYTKQIDHLDRAMEAAQAHVDAHGISDQNISRAEMLFAEIAFAGWHTMPDNFSLVPDLGRVPQPVGYSYESALETIQAVFDVACNGGPPLTEIEKDDFWTACRWLQEYAENANI